MSTYRSILAVGQVRILLGAAVFAGLSLGLPLALILLIQRNGSFESAGAVAGCFAVAGAVFGPVRGRLVDRHGQTRVLPPLAMLSATSLIALAALAQLRAAMPVLAAFALLAGATVAPLVPSLRALWADLLDQDLRPAAYALQSMVTELGYVLGPLAASVLIWLGSPFLAVVALALSQLVALLVFSATPASRRWQPAERGSLKHPAPLRASGLRTLLLVTLPFGLVFGGVDLAVPAFMTREGQEALAGVALATMAIGSVCGGLVYGSLQFRSESLAAQYVGLLAILGIAVAGMALARNPLALIALGILAGLLIAPITIVIYRLLDLVAPAGAPTESLSWVMTAFAAGLASGTAAAGVLAERVGTARVFALAGLMCLLASAVAWMRRRTLEVSRRPVGGPALDADTSLDEESHLLDT